MSEEEDVKIVITFKHYGSEPNIYFEGSLTANQLASLASYFEYKAKSIWNKADLINEQQLVEQEKIKNQIVTPSTKLAKASIDERSLSS